MKSQQQQEEEILNQPEEMTCTMRTYHKTSTPPPPLPSSSSEFVLPPSHSQQQHRRRISSDTTTTTKTGLPELILTHVHCYNMKMKMNKIPSSSSSPNLKDMMINGTGSDNAFTTDAATTDASSISNNFTSIPFSKRFDSFGSSHERSKSFRNNINSMDPQQHQQQQQRFSRSNSPSLRQRGSSCDMNIQQSHHQHHHQVLKEKIIIPVNDIAKVHVHNYDDDDNDDNNDNNNGKNTKKNKRKSNSSNTNTKGTKNEEQNYKRTIGITTVSSGWYYEFIMESMNEQLVLITFLKVNSLSSTSSSTATKVMGATAGGNKTKIEFVPLLKNQNQNNQNDDDATRRTVDSSIIHKNCDSSSSKNVTSNVTNNTNDNTATATATATATTTENGGDNDYDIDVLNRSIELNPSNLTQTTQQSNKSFDVETFTAKRMKERLKRDSISEKVERRMHRFISSLEELSSSFNKCACGCFYDDPTSTVTTVKSAVVMSSSIDKNHGGCRSRRNTASTVSSSDNQNDDIDDDVPNVIDPVTMTTTSTKYEFGNSNNSGMVKKKQHQEEFMMYAQLPSGLSVESPSEDDYSYSSAAVDILRPVPILTKDI
jgi:hypothetical protein